MPSDIIFIFVGSMVIEELILKLDAFIGLNIERKSQDVLIEESLQRYKEDLAREKIAIGSLDQFLNVSQSNKAIKKEVSFEIVIIFEKELNKTKKMVECTTSEDIKTYEEMVEMSKKYYKSLKEKQAEFEKKSNSDFLKKAVSDIDLAVKCITDSSPILEKNIVKSKTYIEEVTNHISKIKENKDFLISDTHKIKIDTLTKRKWARVFAKIYVSNPFKIHVINGDKKDVDSYLHFKPPEQNKDTAIMKKVKKMKENLEEDISEKKKKKEEDKDRKFDKDNETRIFDQKDGINHFKPNLKIKKLNE